MTDSRIEAAEQLEALFEWLDADLARARSPKILNALNQARRLPAVIRAEEGSGTVVTVTHVREVVVSAPKAPREPKYDAHDIAMTQRLIDAGALPPDATPADFHEWQKKRQAEMARVPSLAQQEANYHASRRGNSNGS